MDGGGGRGRGRGRGRRGECVRSKGRGRGQSHLGPAGVESVEGGVSVTETGTGHGAGEW